MHIEIKLTHFFIRLFISTKSPWESIEFGHILLCFRLIGCLLNCCWLSNETDTLSKDCVFELEISFVRCVCSFLRLVIALYFIEWRFRSFCGRIFAWIIIRDRPSNDNLSCRTTDWRLVKTGLLDLFAEDCEHWPIFFIWVNCNFDINNKKVSSWNLYIQWRSILLLVFSFYFWDRKWTFLWFLSIQIRFSPN